MGRPQGGLCFVIIYSLNTGVFFLIIELPQMAPHPGRTYFMDLNILVFILVGFVAQMIDGALGMAYGVSSNTFLLGLGIPPAAASASVHMAEVVTTGIPGFSHWKL